MFDRFDTWLIIALVVVTLFCGIDAWITSLYRRNKEQAGEIRRLRHALREAEDSNIWLATRYDAVKGHCTFIRDTENDGLRAELKAREQKINELQTLLDQKWAEASNQTGKAAKKK